MIDPDSLLGNGGFVPTACSFGSILGSKISGFTLDAFGLFAKPGGAREPLFLPIAIRRKVFPIHLSSVLSDSYVAETIFRIVDI